MFAAVPLYVLYTYCIYPDHIKKYLQEVIPFEIDIMPLPALLDPQGKFVSCTMPQLGLNEMGEVGG